MIHHFGHHLGYFSGRGINHENQEFSASLELTKILHGKGIQIRFQAKAIQGDEIFHSEVSTIAPHIGGGFSLFNLNTNTPFMAEHRLVSEVADEEGIEFVFRFGSTDNKKSFREEIKLKLMKSGEVSYQYYWGMPGGEFAYRSGVVCKPKE